jgi:hypothetical protein
MRALLAVVRVACGLHGKADCKEFAGWLDAS